MGYPGWMSKEERAIKLVPNGKLKHADLPSVRPSAMGIHRRTKTGRVRQPIRWLQGFVIPDEETGQIELI